VTVPRYEGKAGMVALLLRESQKTDISPFLEQLANLVNLNLPSYARPLFVRMRSNEMNKTTTFKYQKHHYSQQGFEKGQIEQEGDSVFCYFEKHYVPLDTTLYQKIQAGEIKF
jgi:hypothetical protein